MRREQKYPDTKSFHFFNANPRGKYTTDCVYRAICTALDQSWEQTVMELAQASCASGYAPNSSEGMNYYLESKGWKKQRQPKKQDGKKYTGSQFVKMFKGTCVANIGGNHTVCIKGGKVLDIWDSTDGCIGNYWIKEE